LYEMKKENIDVDSSVERSTSLQELKNVFDSESKFTLTERISSPPSTSQPSPATGVEEITNVFDSESEFTLKESIPTPSTNSRTSPETSAEGSLEIFFKPVNDVSISNASESVDDEIRAELTVQQTIAVMLRATAMKRLHNLRIKWQIAVNALSKHRNLNKGNRSNSAEESNNFEKINESEVKELETICNSLGHKVTEAAKSVQDLSKSLKSLSDRLLNYCSKSSVEGRIPEAKIEELAKAMKSHIASLPPETHRPDSPGDDGIYVFGSDEFHNEIDPSYGGGGREIQDVNDDYDQNFEVEEVPF